MIETILTILGIIVTGVFSTVTAIINSNARQARTEQAFKDAQEQMQKNLDSLNKRMGELSETDSCCVRLQGDVAEIKESIEVLSATVNQFKAESDLADDATRETLKALCRDRINQGHRYFMKRGEIDERSKESILSIGDCYLEVLKGNSFVEEEIEDIKGLNVVPLP